MQLRRDRYRGRAWDIRDDDGPTDWYRQGFYDGERGWLRHRPKAPSLQVSKLPRKKIEIKSKHKRYEKHLERLGGTYKPSSQSWVFPESDLPKLKCDKQLNRYGELWKGVSAEEFEQAREAYSEGYAAGQGAIATITPHEEKLW